MGAEAALRFTRAQRMLSEHWSANHDLRVAIGQIRMEWTAKANTRSMLHALELAANAGARICVFPELALTGFHRQIRAEATPKLVLGHMSAVQRRCAHHSIAMVLGAPTFDSDGTAFNSCVFVDEGGDRIGVVEKIGLTPAEETFFARGRTRPVVQVRGYRATAILCREIDDWANLQTQPALSAQIVFWPGAMRPAVDGSISNHVKHARQLARATGTFIVQANWPNSLNYPEESVEAGQSVVIGPAGDELIRLPVAQAGVAIFTLGHPTFDWHAQTGSD